MRHWIVLQIAKTMDEIEIEMNGHITTLTSNEANKPKKGQPITPVIKEARFRLRH